MEKPSQAFSIAFFAASREEHLLLKFAPNAEVHPFGRYNRCVNIRRIALVHAAMLLAACSSLRATSIPVPDSAGDARPTQAAAARVDIGAAATAAESFVNALNAGDYGRAHELLDAAGRSEAPTPADLQAAYDEARTDGRSETMTARLVGGLVADANGLVTAQLATDWQSRLLDTFPVTTNLTLVDDGAEWRVRWTRDAVAPGFDGGKIRLQQSWLPRAGIMTADGVEIAGPSERRQVGVQRSRIGDAAEEQRMLTALAKATGLSEDEIRSKYADAPADWFVPIALVSVETLGEYAAQLEEFAAVTARAAFVRERYQPEFAPHLIGSVGPIPAEVVDDYRARGYSGDEIVGRSGVEAGAEAILSGQPERVLYVAGRDRQRLLVERPAVRGESVELTIRSTLQMSAQQLLEGRRGAIVVMDVRDGAVRAMASAPTFDPTNVRQADVDGGALLNRAVQGLYPPGSTFKIVTMAAALGEGLAQPDTAFQDNGTWSGYGADFVKTCWREGGHGRITLQNGLTASCNIVFYEVGKWLEEKSSHLLGDYARRFGFGAPTGIELTGEQGGNAPDPDSVQQAYGMAWRPGDTVNMAVGQGYLLVTPLQIARMTAAIADGGLLRTPRLIGAPLPQTAPEPQTAPLSAEHLAAIQEAMLGVTTNARIGTTTYRFANFEYYEIGGRWVPGADLTVAARKSARRLTVAGKSGTAQAPGDAQPHAWFTAYAPADAPEIAVTVLLENAGQGSGQAGPVARQMIEAYFGLPISPTPKDALAND